MEFPDLPAKDRSRMPAAHPVPPARQPATSPRQENGAAPAPGNCFRLSVALDSFPEHRIGPNQTMANQTLPRRPRLLGPRKTFAIVASMYNEACMNGLVESTKSELLAIMPTASIPLYRVPGAWEIPVCAEYVLQHTHADVIIALGVVIRGETGHADMITLALNHELQTMATRHLTPVINMVLLCNNLKDAEERCLGTTINRGIEAARAALNMAELFQKLHTAYPSPKGKEEDE
jgi:6,7-dimethyl-8-ribityllumazine synthase